MNAAVKGLSGLEREVIELFVQLAGMIGYPRSMGELYGMLFVSPDPLCTDDLIARLRISKGSASQGLKTLRNFGAIRTVYVPGDRRQHYEAEMNMRKILVNFIREQAGTNLAATSERLQTIDRLLADEGDTDFEVLRSRIKDFRRWQLRAAKVAPVIMKLVEAR